MSKSFRFFVILGIFSIIFYCLYPSIRYYLVASEEARKITEIPLEQREAFNFNLKALQEAKTLDPLKERIIGFGLDIKGGIYIVMQIDFSDMAKKRSKAVDDLSDEEKKEALSRIVFIIQNRIDQFGVSDVVLRKVGFDKIIIQIPGETNSERIENILQTTGNLEFKFVAEEGFDLLNYDEKQKKVLNQKTLEKDYDVAFLYEKDALGKRVPVSPVLLQKKAELNANRIVNASMNYDQYGEIVVSFELDAKGANIFSEVTGNNVGKRLAIVLDRKKVYSMPKIGGRIFGQGQIDGGFNAQEATDLALILKSGSLPGKLSIVSKEVIGPKLGQESLLKSLKAMFFGIIAIFIFMIFRYRLSGLIASLALILNGMVVLALLAPFQLSLSLSGIAGLLLTIGIAIDANVLIFERIREEFFHNKEDFSQAYIKGYQKAFWSIFDANITTLIAAFVLSSYGEGVIKGFATTLFIGVIVSMFTALFLTRFVFDVCFYFNTSIKFKRIWI